jgi:thiol-disulfide isomerase/thioredoxin
MIKNLTRAKGFVVTMVGAAMFLAACTSGSSESSNADTSVSPALSQTAQPAQSTGTNQAAGNYITYEVYEASKASYADSKVVLFFNASWCSTCKKARDNFESSLSEIPADMTIVVVDFDDSTELRQKYGVTLQHTFIQVDSAGEKIAKWSGTTTIAGILENII